MCLSRFPVHLKAHMCFTYLLAVLPTMRYQRRVGGAAILVMHARAHPHGQAHAEQHTLAAHANAVHFSHTAQKSER